MSPWIVFYAVGVCRLVLGAGLQFNDWLNGEGDRYRSTDAGRQVLEQTSAADLTPVERGQLDYEDVHGATAYLPEEWSPGEESLRR